VSGTVNTAKAPTATGICKPTTTQLGGWHALLVIGYGDIDRYWIVKNSWAPLGVSEASASCPTTRNLLEGATA
jgi:hypothetical protein